MLAATREPGPFNRLKSRLAIKVSKICRPLKCRSGVAIYSQRTTRVTSPAAKVT